MSLLYKSAFAIAEDIRAGKCSACEVLEFFVDRVERLNAPLNAVVALDLERARARATEADQAVARGENWGALHGVPMTIKDAFCTSGLTTTGGIPELEGSVPKQNALAVQRLVDAGAIIFGKTNVPFMSADLQSYNDIYGCTNNPWNIARTCGGSSGGAAASVAAGLTPLEIGSDIGGSIRVPAHFNGIYGHKPSHGIVPQRGHLPPGPQTVSEADLSVVGPLGHCVADIDKALDLLAGPLPEHANAWQLSLPKATFSEVSELRVAVWADDEFCRVDREIATSIEQAAACLEKLGAQVDYEARPDIDPIANHRNYLQLLSAVMGSGMPVQVLEEAQKIVEAADATDHSDAIEQARGIAIRHRDWLRANERRLRYQASWSNFFSEYDVLLCPVTHVTAFSHDHKGSMMDRTLMVNGEERPYIEALRWPGLSLNALLPATAVPIAQSSEGLPIGMQIVGPYLGDKTTLAVAALIEQHHRSFNAPPELSAE